MDPRIFKFEVTADSQVRPGVGIIAAYVPAELEWPAIVALACDPHHDPGRPIKDMVPAAINHVLADIGTPAETLNWIMIDALGRFNIAEPEWSNAATATLPEVTYRQFPTGLGVEAFLKETGAAGEVALEMLSAASAAPGKEEEEPSVQAFLDAIESHSNLPVPSTLFHLVEDAVSKGDIKKVASVIQSDPVVSLSLINYANAARFIGADKTASVRQAVVRLGMNFVLRVVFVAAMMMRYQKGRCAEFNYANYWMNSLATGAAMRALLPEFEIPETMADDAHAAGLVSGIGWLAVAETYPALMTKYLQRCCGKDPLPKIRLQNEIFPCPIRLVSERYLQRFSFPDAVSATVAGKSGGEYNLGECLARATRIAQKLAPLNCLAVLPVTQVPTACKAEWEHWQSMLKNVKR